MRHEGRNLHLILIETHHHVCRETPKLADFLYALCQANETNIDAFCSILDTTILVLLAYNRNHGVRNCHIWWSLHLMFFSLTGTGRNKGKNSPSELISGSRQSLLNCYSGFHLSTNTVPLLGEEIVLENRKKIKLHTQLCSTVPNLTNHCWLKRQSFSGFPVRSQLVLLWIFLLHGNEAEVHRERQMARSNVTYPNVHVRQRAFWHTSQAES